MYTLDPKLASKADVIGAYIQDTGKYVGTFLRAEKLVSKQNKTAGIGFTFKADDSRECRFDLWTHREDGTELSSLAQVNALMACLKLRTLEVQPANVKKWDNGAEVVMSAPCFTALMGPRIGLLLRAEEYDKMKDGQKTGESGWRMGLFAIFQADTELMASEVLKSKTKPEQLEKVMALLADKPLKKRGAQPAPTGGGAHGGNGDLASMDDMDDIPF